MRRLLMIALLAAAALPAAALVPQPVEVEYLVGMPLAVTEVVEVGVPAPQVEQVVYRLNTARVPVVDSVEIIRYTAFPVVVERYPPAQPVYFEPQGLDVGWQLDELDMLTLLAAHLGAGLQGELLADAVLRDVALLGFDAGIDGRWRRAPRPVRQEFLYFVEPGYRFDTRRGLFRERVVVVSDDDFVDYRRRRVTRVRDRDRLRQRLDARVAGRDRWIDRIFDRDPVRRPVRDTAAERDRVRQRIVRDRDDARPRDVPPGHAKHGPGGPHPTPGHVENAGPGGPPGHDRDGLLIGRDDDDRRRVDRDRRERRRAEGADGADNRAERRKPAKPNRGRAAAAPRDRDRDRPAAGRDGRPGNGKDKAKGDDEGRSQSRSNDKKGRGEGRGH